MSLLKGNQQKSRRILHITLLLSLVATLLPVSVLASFDYCEVKQCKNHVACNNDGDYSDDCPDAVDMVPMSEFKHIIVKWCNRLRHKVASGETHLKPAARMGAMAWDEELANLAELNVKRCRMGLDRCHPTEDFFYSGQNTGQFDLTGGDFPPLQLLQQRVYAWMSGLSKINMGILKKYPVKARDPAIGRVAVLINERNNRVGCAAVTMALSNDTTRFILACNYATTNLIGDQVYKPGKPGSKCKKGRHKEYKSLCALSEDYKNNQY